MAIRECPHCHSRVFVLKDGICPTCRRDVTDLSGVDVRKSSIELLATMKLPHVCISCGAPTSRAVHVTGHDARPVVTHGPGGWSLFFSVLALLLLPFTIFGSERRESHAVSSVTRLLPQCELCSADEIAPLSVDSLRESMIVVADRQFINELRWLNR